jgi:hypothetical protein
MRQGVVHDERDVWASDEIVLAVQRHWFQSGQSGCAFSRQLVRDERSSGWRARVVRRLRANPDRSQRAHLNAILDDAIDDPGCELLSLVFPEVESGADLSHLIETLSRLDRGVLLEPQVHDELVAVSIRFRLAGDVLAWVLGFGSFSFLPATRQAPVTEILFRTKRGTVGDLDVPAHDASQAHVADVPLRMDSRRFGRLWSGSIRQTQSILGREKRTFSRARISFALPVANWARTSRVNPGAAERGDNQTD